MPTQPDAHGRPPASLRLLFKKWQKSSLADLEDSDEVLDFIKPANAASKLLFKTDVVPSNVLMQAFSQILGEEHARHSLAESFERKRFHVTTLPGLFVYPSLLPVDVQAELLNRLLHRDLSNEAHKTNLHLHYGIPYPSYSSSTAPGSPGGSFFRERPQTLLKPRDPSLHSPLTVRQMLDRKLRWLTLGGQYDWTAKVYPSEQSPAFPVDICALIRSLWPDVDAQAAIVNFYTPGDTLSVHRDVSEECDRGLVSISIGCDAIFVIGNADGSSHTTLRLRSGDALLMSGEARFAWHAVPRILAGTCPSALQDWPAVSPDWPDEAWKGWLNNKRINLNVRQMKAN